MNGPSLATLLALGAAAAGCAAAAEPPTGPDDATVALGQHGALGSAAVTPLRIEEDSRCPAEVQCVQAGTVRVAVRIEEGGGRRETVLTLSEPLALDGGRWLSLVAVCPYPRQPGRIERAAYRFTFATAADGAAPASDLPCAP